MHKHMIYLASGSSRRFGGNKLLYELEGKPMYLYGLEILREAVSKRSDCSLLVVSRYEEIRKGAEAMGIKTVDSPESEKGISYTIRAGICALGRVPAEDFLLFAVADQPYLTLDSLERLLDAAAPGVEGASLCYGERPGNPALFSGRLLPELLALEADMGGRTVLRKHRTVFVKAASLSELEDIDIRE